LALRAWQAPVRNHPLMLLSGVGTNAVGFDLSPGVSLVFLLLLASNRIKHVNQKIKKDDGWYEPEL
jgi:hypothetical protein